MSPGGIGRVRIQSFFCGDLLHNLDFKVPFRKDLLQSRVFFLCSSRRSRFTSSTDMPLGTLGEIQLKVSRFLLYITPQIVEIPRENFVIHSQASLLPNHTSALLWVYFSISVIHLFAFLSLISFSAISTVSNCFRSSSHRGSSPLPGKICCFLLAAQPAGGP